MSWVASRGEKNILSYLILQQCIRRSHLKMFMLCSCSCVRGTTALNKLLQYLARADTPMSFRGHLESLATPPLSRAPWKSLVAHSLIAQNLLKRTISEDVTRPESLSVGDFDFPQFPALKNKIILARFWQGEEQWQRQENKKININKIKAVLV